MTVVDASVWVSRLVAQDVNHQVSRQWLETQMAQGQRLIAPVLLLAEIAGAIARRTGSSELARQAIDQILQIPNFHIVTIDYELGQTATKLAAELYLRGADAIYVALAYRLGVPLVSWDAEQLERASKLIQAARPEVT